MSLEELVKVAGALEISLADLLGTEILHARQSPRSDLVTAGASGNEGWASVGSLRTLARR